VRENPEILKPARPAPPKTRDGIGAVVSRRMRRYRPFWGVFVTTLVLDQVSKQIVLACIPSSYEHPPVTVIPGFFNLMHIYNRGAAFSMLNGQGWLLVLLALGALAAIFRWRRSLELEKLPVQWAFGLLTGGIVGNVIDRMLHGFVVDFLDVILPFYGNWPTFNIADMGICIGVFLYLFLSLRSPTEAGKA
jgi:signal peptidase II